MTETKRPYITCHMMTTIDGKITSADGTDILSDNYFDLYTQTEDMLEGANAWMLGRVTMQMFASTEQESLSDSSSTINTEDFVADHESSLYMFGVDTKGVLRWRQNSIKLSNIDTPLHLVIVVTNQTPKNYLQYLKEKQISYVFAGDDEIDFDVLFEKMKAQFGIEKLLLEGGGKLNGSVMEKDLIDEISLLITPTVINQSGAPSLFENTNCSQPNLKTFSLFEVRALDKGSVWVRYRK